MIRTIVKSNDNKLTLDPPDDLVGKMIEVIAFSADDMTTVSDKQSSKEVRVADLKNKLRHFNFNSGGYRFDRDEANNCE